MDVYPPTLDVLYALSHKGKIYGSTGCVRISAEKRFIDFCQLLLDQKGFPKTTSPSTVQLLYLDPPIPYNHMGVLPDGAEPLPPNMPLSSKVITDDNGNIYLVAEIPRESCI